MSQEQAIKPMSGRRAICKHVLGSLLGFTFLLSTSYCAAAGEPTMYFHSFSFDVITDATKYGHPEVEVLDYAYGDGNEARTRPSSVDREMSKYFYRQNITGPMPRGDFLYVKWRVKANGHVYDDRVDLHDRLPENMTDYGLHFMISNDKLYIFLLPPEESIDTFGRKTVSVGS